MYSCDCSRVKTYVPVRASFSPEGKIMPTAIYWTDGAVYTIDRVESFRRLAFTKNGQRCDRYTVIVQGRRSYLYFECFLNSKGERMGRWFVEHAA